MKGFFAALLELPTGIRWLLTSGFVLLIVALSVTPARSRPGDSVLHWIVNITATPVQKVLHVLVYATLAALLVWSLDGIASRRLRFALALTLAVAIGAILEWYQLRVPGRFGTAVDVLLNTIGALLGLIVAALLL